MPHALHQMPSNEALAERGIGAGGAVVAKSDQPIAVEVRATLGALPHVM
jgi:hypothetical protein